MTIATTAKSKVQKPIETKDVRGKEQQNKSQSSKITQPVEEIKECQDQCQKLYREGTKYDICGNTCKVEGKHRLEECRCSSHLLQNETSKAEQKSQEEKAKRESQSKFTPEDE